MTDTSDAGAKQLLCGLDIPIDKTIVVGPGTTVQLRGWAFSPAGRISKLTLLAGNEKLPIDNHSWIRRDVFEASFLNTDPEGHSLFSEFIVIFPIAAVEGQEVRELQLQATLRDGTRLDPVKLGEVTLIPELPYDAADVRWPGKGAKVAICMATFNPNEEAFARQIETIRRQDHDNWIVIISDDSSTKTAREVIRRAVGNDDRFYYFQNASRLGFYRNFEAALARVPADADYVALSDQDDSWYSDKISTLIGAIGERSLVFSDCRIADSEGRIVAETFWTYRRNTYYDLTKMFLANSVTGAACLFRRNLVDLSIPFPPPIGGSVHDQWLGLMALVQSGLAYVDRPLYDYVQHDGNAIGHTYKEPFPGLGTAGRRLYNAYRTKTGTLATGNMILHEAWNEFPKLVQKSVWASTMDLRIADMRPKDRKVIKGMTRYYTGLAQSVRQKFAASSKNRWTMNAEGYLLWSAIGVRLRNAYYRWRGSAIVKAASKVRRQAQLNPTAPTSPNIVVGGDNPASWIFHNVKPLKLRISAKNPKRINVILATIDFRYIFGGYIGMFNFALRLRREGFEVRIILTEMTDFDPGRWVEELKKYPGITSLLDEVEVIYCFDRNVEVPVSPDDKFVATNCWAAHLAHLAHQELGTGRFMFMVQEYEPYFLPMNSISALFQQSYRFPQFDLFSTTHLRDFFAQEKIGIFDQPDAKQHHAVFSNAIQKFTPRYEDMVGRARRILFYARPEPHAARNMFELGLKALMDLANSDDVDLDGWKFYGMGSLGGVRNLPLAPGIDIELMPKTDLKTYIDRMTKHDVGLSLMLTPHPSLVPLEMASAGMWAVTNTFENKTADSLSAISSNIIATEPTLDAIVDGLRLAISRADRYEDRLKGSKVNWPTSWDDAFPEKTIDKVVNFLRSS